MKRAAICALGLLVLGWGEGVSAQRPLQVLRWREQLGLTSEQVAQIQKLLKTHRNAAFPLQQELRAKTHALRNALEAEHPDEATIGRLMLERRALQKQLRELNQKLRADIEAVLTPEQKQKLQQWRQTREPRPLRRPFFGARP